MADQVPHPVKRERMERLVELVQRRALERSRTLRRHDAGGARRGAEPDRPRQTARPHAAQQDGQLRRPGAAGRSRGRRDHGRHLHDAGGRGVAASERERRSLADRSHGPRRRDLRADRRRQDRCRGRAGRVCCASAASTPVAVSADALQVYEGLDVLAAKPTIDELERLEHRLVSVVPIDRGRSASPSSPSALIARSTPSLDGGGAADRGRRHRPVPARCADGAGAEAACRSRASRGARARARGELGSKALHGQLSQRTAESIHPNDRKRIVRALELERMGDPARTRPPPSCGRRSCGGPRSLFGIVMDRAAARGAHRRAGPAHARIRSAGRGGAGDRAGRLLNRGKAIGVEELAAHLRGEATLEEAAARIERRHRQYAKRQLTWMQEDARRAS